MILWQPLKEQSIIQQLFRKGRKNKWTIWQWLFKRTRRKEQITNNLMIILQKGEEKNNEQLNANRSKEQKVMNK